MQEQELYWTREAAKERGEMPATRPSGPYFDAYLRHFLLLTHISPFCSLQTKTEDKKRKERFDHRSQRFVVFQFFGEDVNVSFAFWWRLRLSPWKTMCRCFQPERAMSELLSSLRRSFLQRSFWRIYESNNTHHLKPTGALACQITWTSTTIVVA
jgi:hypothetical protein